MEKFKQCEKEMKTKAFSKEGLIAAARLDPSERAKLELTQWLTNNVDELSHQMEAAEAEVEQLAGSGKKKKGAGGAAAERSAELERLNERRSWHISKLELILRLLENGNLETDEVSTIKDDVAYFVESNAVSRLTVAVQLVQRCRASDAPFHGHASRMRISKRTRASMKSSSWTSKKRPLV